MIKRSSIAKLFTTSWALLLLGVPSLEAQEINGPPAEVIYDLTYPLLIPSQSVDGLSQQWYSNGHTFSFMGEIPIGKTGGVGYGFGFSIHNLHNNLAYVDGSNPSGSTLNTAVLTDSVFNINEQDLSYFDIPLEYRYRGKSGPRGGFFRAVVGARLGYRIVASAYHRDEDYAIRQYRIFDADPWRLQVYARIGYSELAVFFGYDVLPNLQRSNNGEVVNFHMASAGVSLLL